MQANPVLRRLLASSMALVCALVAGCDPLVLMTGEDPEKQDILFSGCHSVHADGICELPEHKNKQPATLTFVIQTEHLPKIITQSGNQQDVIVAGKTANPRFARPSKTVSDFAWIFLKAQNHW